MANELGSIENGNATDTVVLNRNLFEIDPDSTIDTEIVHTIFAGEIVYDATDVAERVPSIVKPAARSSPDSESLVMGTVAAAGLASGLARAPQLAAERSRAGDGGMGTRRRLLRRHLGTHSAKPRSGGTGPLRLTPLQLLEGLAALVPPPRFHRHRYFGAPVRTTVYWKSLRRPRLAGRGRTQPDHR